MCFVHMNCVFSTNYVQMAGMNATWKFNGILIPGLLKAFLYTVGIENKNKSIYYISIYSLGTNNCFFFFFSKNA